MIIFIKNLQKYATKNKIYRNFSNYNYKPPWKILFFGSDNFSLYSLEALYSEFINNRQIISRLEVVTNVNKDNRHNAVRKFADKRKLKVHNWPNTTEGFDIGLVVSFGHLIPERIIKQFPLGMLNVHASLLPRWRGAAPIIYALANGDQRTGVSIMQIKPNKFDIGDIITQDVVDIPNDMKMLELYCILGKLGANKLLEVVRSLPDILQTARPQSDEGVTFAPKVTPAFAQIKWDEMTAQEIYNLDRAVTSLYNIWTTYNGVQIKLVDIEIDKKENCQGKEKETRAKPGFIDYDKGLKVLRILCANGSWIKVKSIKITGRKLMNAADFNNGFLKNQNVFYFK